MTAPGPQPLLHEHATMGAARLAARYGGRLSTETVQALIPDPHQLLRPPQLPLP